MNKTKHTISFLDVERILECIEKVQEASLTHLIELLRVYMGTKKVVRLVINETEWELVEPIVTQLSLEAILSKKKLSQVNADKFGNKFMVSVNDNSSTGYRALFLGKGKEVFQCARAEDEGESSTLIGMLLEIPSCCTNFYAKNIQKGNDWLPLWLKSSGSNRLFFNPLGNRIIANITGCNLAGDYLPCSINCEQTHKNAFRGIEALEQVGFENIINQIVPKLEWPICFLEGNIIFLTDATRHTKFDNNKLLYEFSQGSLCITGANKKKLEKTLSKANRLHISRDSLFFESEGKSILKSSLWNSSIHSVSQLYSSKSYFLAFDRFDLK